MGQEEDFEEARQKATKLGAKKVRRVETAMKTPRNNCPFY